MGILKTLYNCIILKKENQRNKANSQTIIYRRRRRMIVSYNQILLKFTNAHEIAFNMYFIRFFHTRYTCTRISVTKGFNIRL